jgi:hypothetical protein
MVRDCIIATFSNNFSGGKLRAFPPNCEMVRDCIAAFPTISVKG